LAGRVDDLATDSDVGDDWRGAEGFCFEQNIIVYNAVFDGQVVEELAQGFFESGILDGKGDRWRFERLGIVEENVFGLFFDVGEDLLQRGILFLEGDLTPSREAYVRKANHQREGCPFHNQLV